MLNKDGWCTESGGFFGDENSHQNPTHLKKYPQCKIDKYSIEE